MSMINLFCKTKGYSSDLIHWFVCAYRGKYDVDKPIASIIGSFLPSDINEIAKQIDKEGYYVFKNQLPTEVVNELYDFAVKANAYVRPSYVSGIPYDEREQNTIDRDNPAAVRYDFTTAQLLENNTVQVLLSEKLFWVIAQEYLGCKPVADVVGMWWHTAFDKEPNPEAATMYHFDMDRLKWLKFFFYITDVEVDNGPHAFIRGTHKRGSIPYRFLKKGYARLSDSEVFSFYDKKDEIIYTAPRGTIIAEDTRGLHKGSPVQKGDRLLFQIQFSDCLFGANLTKSPFPKNIDNNLQSAVKDYPDIYRQYNI